MAKVRETNEITGDTYEQNRANIVKPKTTGIEIADYDLFGLNESREVVTYSDDSADDKDDEEEDGGNDPKGDGDLVEGTGEDV